MAIVLHTTEFFMKFKKNDWNCKKIFQFKLNNSVVYCEICAFHISDYVAYCFLISSCAFKGYSSHLVTVMSLVSLLALAPLLTSLYHWSFLPSMDYHFTLKPEATSSSKPRYLKLNNITSQKTVTFTDYPLLEARSGLIDLIIILLC
jgi:hypothetical protein